METEKNEIQKTPPASPLAMAAELCKAGGLEPSKLKELLDVQMAWEANEAKKAYTVAMSEFKADPPEILKDKTVSYKEVKYKHSSLHNVTTKINVALSIHGLTASWIQEQDNGSIKITCKITHVMGHSESTSLSAPPDATGSKNVIQAIGSTVTYLQRYTLLSITGLATHDQDDDGAGSGKPPEPPKPAKPTKQEQTTLDKIAKKLQESAPAGKIVSVKRLAVVMFSSKGRYPDGKTDVDKVAQFLVTENVMQQIWEDKKPEEAKGSTSKAKFNYLCGTCDLEFDDPEGNDPEKPKCPKCLSLDVTMEVE